MTMNLPYTMYPPPYPQSNENKNPRFHSGVGDFFQVFQLDQQLKRLVSSFLY